MSPAEVPQLVAWQILLHWLMSDMLWFSRSSISTAAWPCGLSWSTHWHFLQFFLNKDSIIVLWFTVILFALIGSPLLTFVSILTTHSCFLFLTSRTSDSLFAVITLFIVYLLLLHFPTVKLNLDFQALKKRKKNRQCVFVFDTCLFLPSPFLNL